MFFSMFKKEWEEVLEGMGIGYCVQSRVNTITKLMDGWMDG